MWRDYRVLSSHDTDMRRGRSTSIPPWEEEEEERWGVGAQNLVLCGISSQRPIATGCGVLCISKLHSTDLGGATAGGRKRGGQGGDLNTSCFTHSGNVAGSLREREKKAQPYCVECF